jgi:hypothetical protein
LTVSGCRRRRSTVLVVPLITMRRFRSSAPKAKNGFVARRIVSSPLARRNNIGKNPTNSAGCSERSFAYRGHYLGCGGEALEARPCFLIFLCEKSPAGEAREPQHRAGRLNQTYVATFPGSCALRSSSNGEFKSWAKASTLALKPRPADPAAQLSKVWPGPTAHPDCGPVKQGFASP